MALGSQIEKLDDVILKQNAKDAIDNHSSELYTLSKSIWKNPELGFQESFAHEQLTKFMAEHGFNVTPHYTLDTAFRAECGEDGGLTIGLISEYDALPEVGHGCGHNLIAESGVAAALGLKIALDAVNHKPKVKVVLLGTPAEEGGGGKILMINNGCFKDIDICMMVHPSQVDILKPVALACDSVTVTYKGHDDHVAAFPWEGINALDAAVMAYTNISALRQQMKPKWGVHGIVSEGGIKPNIIPDRAQLMYFIRAPTDEELEVLKEKVTSCFEAAALSTGCKVHVEWNPLRYSSVDTSSTLADLYQANVKSLGVTFDPQVQQKTRGSTDMGNVSKIIPSIHVMYDIGYEVSGHSHAFRAAAITENAHAKTMIASKAMAMTAIDILCNPELMQETSSNFKNKT